MFLRDVMEQVSSTLNVICTSYAIRGLQKTLTALNYRTKEGDGKKQDITHT